jgi:hypothetical protein
MLLLGGKQLLHKLLFARRLCNMDDRIIFPLHENQSLVGYIGRTCLELSESNPK